MASPIRLKSGAHDRDDIFLKTQSLYRKQMPRNGSCLFRAIAEQMYDTQSLHYQVRMECVRFMTLKRRIFEKQIARDFDEYTLCMSRPRTRGTMLELRAMCLLYRRNIQLYQYNKPAVLITFNKQFRQHFTIYYTWDDHFDLLYSAEYCEAAAAAQAICYKLIFKRLLRLPDVELAVDRMLFPKAFKKGRSFQLDRPQDTNCMLIEKWQCSFHNGTSTVSCMIQVLGANCLPFSYKVAKSLHAQFYRNVELDHYRETLEENQKPRPQCHGNGHNLKVGDKCVVSMPQGDFDCYIQSIDWDTETCIVYVVYLCQKIEVSLFTVRPSPLEEFQPWPVPAAEVQPMNQLTHQQYQSTSIIHYTVTQQMSHSFYHFIG